MRIQAKLMIGEVTLNLDAEVPPDERTIAITNAPPYCLIIPRDRLCLSALGFSPKVLKEFQNQGFKTIADVIGRTGWRIQATGLSSQTQMELEQRLQILEKASLLPDTETESKQEYKEPVLFPISVSEEKIVEGETAELFEEVEDNGNGVDQALEKEVVLREVPDTALIAELYLPETIQRTLKAQNINTVAELEKVTKGKLIMTPGLNVDSLNCIERQLAKVGRQLKGGR